MQMRTLAVGALALALAACGGDDDDTGGGSDLRERYVDAVVAVEASQDSPLAGDEIRCWAEAVVDAIGVDDLEAAMTPEEIEQRGSFDPVAAGIDITEDDAGAVVDAVSECVDLRQVFLDELTADDALSPEQVACIDEAVDDDLIRDFTVSALLSSGDGASQDPDAVAELQAAVMPCIGG